MRPKHPREYCLVLYLIVNLVSSGSVSSTSHNALHKGPSGGLKNYPPIVRRGSMNLVSTRYNKATMGKFDELNKVLRVLKVPLPDAYFEQNYQGSKLKFWATNIVCSDIQLGDATLFYEQVGETGIIFHLMFQEITGNCDLDWRYQYPTFFTTIKDSGTADVIISESSFGTGVLMQSQNFATHPPSESEELYCEASIEIEKIKFRGGSTVAILNAIEPSLRQDIETSLNEFACEESQVLNDAITDIVNVLGDFLGNHTEGIPDDRKDVLLPEKNLDLPQEPSSIVKFSEEELLLYAIEWINSMFGSMTEDPSSPHSNGKDLGINKFLRSTILTEGYIAFPGTFFFDDGIVYEGKDIISTTIEIEEIRLIGLDTLSEFQPLDIVGDYTISNQFKWVSWEIEMDINIVVSPPDQEEPVMVENTTVTTKLHDVEIDMSFLMALDLDELELGMLLEIANPEDALSCLASAMYSLEISGLSASISNLDTPTLSGFKSDGIDDLAANLTDGIFEMYNALSVNLLPTIFQTTVRDMVNEEVDENLKGNSSCKVYERASAESYVNFFDLFLSERESLVKGGKGNSQYGDFFRIMKVFIEEEFLRADPRNGKLRINEFIGTFTEERTNITGTLLYPEPFFYLNQSVDDFIDGDIELTVYDSRLDGLNSILSPVDLAVPVEPQILNNKLTMSSVNASTKVLFGIYQDAKALRNELEIDMELQDVSVDLNSLISIIEKSLVEYPLQSITDIDCLLSMISIPKLNSQGIRVDDVDPTLAISQLDISVSNIHLSVNCISCTSPEFHDLTTLLEDPKASEDLTRVSNNLLDLLTGVLEGPLLQVQIDRMLNEASTRCPNHPNYEGKNGTLTYDPIVFNANDERNASGYFFLSFFIVFGCLSLLICASKLTIRYMRNKKHQVFIKSVSKSERQELIFLQQKNEEKHIELNKHTQSLITSPLIPFPVRLLVPMCILGNVALFLSGHFSIGAFVDAEIKIAGEIVSMNEIFSFSIANSIIQMWNAGARALAIIVFLFSGLWPYIKLLTTIFLWFSSPQIVSVTKRESTLLLMDALGKWSFADIFVLVISIVSFRISVQSPQDFSFLPEELYSFNLLVLPKLGLYANFVAQIISQLLSHGVIYYHRKVVSNIGESNEIGENTDNNSIALRSHPFMISGERTGTGVAIRSRANFLVAGIGSISLLLIICGSILPSFALEVFGLIGILVEAGQNFESSFQSFNIFSIAAALFKQSGFTDTSGDYIGLGSLSIIMVVTVCFVPIIQICLNLIRWFKPMTSKQRHRVFLITETITAWQYLEVYIVSIMIASWQLGPLSKFMINGYCGSLSGIFASLAYYRMIDGSDAQCFQVIATVQTAAWLLVIGAFCASLLNHFVGMAEKQFLKEREQAKDLVLRSIEEEAGLKNEEANSEEEAIKDDSIMMPELQFTDYYGWLFQKRSEKAVYQTADKEEDDRES